MNPLQLRLASLRLRLHLVTLWRGVCGIFALVVGAALLVGLADYYVNLPSVIRALALVGLLGSVGYVFLRHLCVPLTTRCDDLTLALRIEDIYPELNDCLASTVQFLEEESSALSSPTLRKQAIEQAMKRADDCDFNRILDGRGVLILGAAAVLAGLLGGWVYFSDTFLANTALARLAEPFGGHTWTQLAINPACPDRIALGQQFMLKAEVSGIIPARARLEIDGRVDKVLTVKKDPSQITAGLTIPFDIPKTPGKFRFRIVANDAEFGWKEVEVLPPPRFTILDGLPSPQLELRFPDYTGLPSPRKLSPGQGNVEEAVVGTHVTFRAAVDRPVAEAWLELQPKKPEVKAAALFGFLGHAEPLEMLTSAALGQTVAGRVSCQLENGGTILSARFIPWLSCDYWLRFQDAHGLASDYKNELRIFADPTPTIDLQQPSSSQTLLADAKVHFKIGVDDEKFAVRSVYLEYRRKNAEGKWLDDEPRRVPILDHDMISREMPRLLTALTPGNLPSQATLRLRPQKLELGARWPLANQFKEGETLVLQICADDFNNLFEPRAVGRSHEIEFRIVGKGELAKQFDEDFAKIQQELVRLQKMQEEALKTVKDVEKNKDNPAAKANHDKLVEAEQLQRQIQERIGERKDEGLRQELKNLQQKMRDNQLPPSDMQDRLRTLSTELDRLVREELQQIEAKLSEARKELTKSAPDKKTPEKTPPEKNQPKQKDALEEARGKQEDAKKTLDELANFLNPWADMHQAKGRTRDLLDKQKQLKKETDKLLAKQDELDKGELKADMQKQADTQKNLEQEAKDLVKLLKEMKPGADTAPKVADAVKLAEQDGGLSQKMKEAEQKLRQPQLNSASQKQQEAIKNLEQVLAALEKENRDQEIEKLRTKQKKAEEKLEAIAKEVEGLRKKVAQANKIEDPKERAEELKKLAPEQEKLKEKAQEEARELAQLRAEKASREMARAAQEMDRAARKLEAGENPEEGQKEALDRVQEAQAKLEEAEEELAREQLARIADRIKGLKERQDAAVAESERIHKDLEKKGSWTSGSKSSLRDSGKTQEGLSQEAGSLKEKLKDAKVFEHILDKAEKSMIKASEAIKERNENAKAAAEELEKEELAAENKAQEKIVKLQKESAQRLQRLLDALKNELAKAEKQENADAGGEQKPMGGDEGGGLKLRGGDGIPPMAQLKALRDEQADLQQRTKDFDERCPDRENLNQEQSAELREIEEDQTRLRDIFGGLMSKNNEKGENP